MVVIVELFRRRIVIHRVDREVAARRILPHLTENIVGHNAARGVLPHARALERPKCRTFDDFPAENDVHKPKPLADDECAALAALDLIGCCIRGYIKVLGRHAKEQIAHGAAHNVSAIAALLERLARALGLPGHQIWRNFVNFLRNNARLFDDDVCGIGFHPAFEPFDDSLKHQRAPCGKGQERSNAGK